MARAQKETYNFLGSYENQWFIKPIFVYHMDRQILSSKIALLQNIFPGIHNSPLEFQKSPSGFNVEGAILEFQRDDFVIQGTIL